MCRRVPAGVDIRPALASSVALLQTRRRGSAARQVHTMQLELRLRVLWTFTIVLLISKITGLKMSSGFKSDAPQDLFSQIANDLGPYRKRGISDSMTNGVYCGIRDPGFRVQIKNQEVYMVGEVEGFQSRNRNIKLALVDVAAEYTDLPDVDFVVGPYDWTATEVQLALGFEEGGPVLSQVGKASCLHLSMYACHIPACRHGLLHARGLLLRERASSSGLLCVTCCCTLSTKESTHLVARVRLKQHRLVSEHTVYQCQAVPADTLLL